MTSIKYIMFLNFLKMMSYSVFFILFPLEYCISKIHAWTTEPNFLGLHPGSAKELLGGFERAA